jgi:hypothetical protein
MASRPDYPGWLAIFFWTTIFDEVHGEAPSAITIVTRREKCLSNLL